MCSSYFNRSLTFKINQLKSKTIHTKSQRYAKMRKLLKTQTKKLSIQHLSHKQIKNHKQKTNKNYESRSTEVNNGTSISRRIR